MFFVDTTVAAGLGEISLPYLGWGANLADFDNDGSARHLRREWARLSPGGWTECGQKYLQRKELYRNLGNGKFEEIARKSSADFLTGKSARGSAVADYDNDGDLDVLVVNLNDRPEPVQERRRQQESLDRLPPGRHTEQPECDRRSHRDRGGRPKADFRSPQRRELSFPRRSAGPFRTR